MDDSSFSVLWVQKKTGGISAALVKQCTVWTTKSFVLQFKKGQKRHVPD